MNDIQPSTNGDNGRDRLGRFTYGNAGGPGNPLSRRVARLRAALVRSVTPATIQRVVEALIRQAEGGDIVAIRELLDRAVGRESLALSVSVENAERAQAEPNVAYKSVDREGAIAMLQRLGVNVVQGEDQEVGQNDALLMNDE